MFDHYHDDMLEGMLEGWAIAELVCLAVKILIAIIVGIVVLIAVGWFALIGIMVGLSAAIDGISAMTKEFRRGLPASGCRSIRKSVAAIGRTGQVGIDATMSATDVSGRYADFGGRLAWGEYVTKFVAVIVAAVTVSAWAVVLLVAAVVYGMSLKLKSGSEGKALEDMTMEVIEIC